MTRKIENINILVFFKFGRKKHLESLQKGNLYMNCTDFFIKKEELEGEKGVGDRLEASHVMNNVKVEFKNRVTQETLFSGNAGSVSIRLNNHLYAPLFCLTYFSKDDFIIIQEDEEKMVLKPNISIKELQLLKKDFKDKDHVLMISPNHFLKQVGEAFQKQNIYAKASPVRYSDFKKNYKDRLQSFEKDQDNVLFWKNIDFKHQREFRIAILNKTVKDKYEINIGNLEHCTALIETNKLLNNFNDFHLELYKKSN